MLVRFSWLASACLLLIGSAAARATPPNPNAPLGLCEARMARADELFPAAKGLKIVVTSFASSNKRFAKLGVDQAQALTQELANYLRTGLTPEEQSASLTGADVYLRYVPCQLSSHAEARAMGQAWGADLMFFGQVSAARGSPAERQFQASVTAVPWHGLPSHYDSRTPAPPLAALDFDFPWLPSARPQALFSAVAGLYAYHSQRYALALSRYTTLSHPSAAVEQPRTIYALFGLSLLSMGQPSAALDTLRKTHEGCAPTDVGCQIVGLSLLGWSQVRLGDRRQGLENYERALMLARTIGATSTELTLAMAIGDVYSLIGEKEKALASIGSALNRARQTSDAISEALALLLLGDVQSTFGDLHKALALFEQSLRLSSHEQFPWLQNIVLISIGTHYCNLGYFRKSLEYLEQALLISKQLGNLRAMVTVLGALSTVHADLGNLKRAFALAEESLTLARQIGDRFWEADALDFRISQASALGLDKKPMDSLLEALSLRRQAGDKPGEAELLYRIGLVRSGDRNHSSALDFYNDSISVHTQIDSRKHAAMVFIQAAYAAARQGNKQKSLEYSEQALEVMKQSGNPELEGGIFLVMGRISSASGEPQKALDYFDRALSRARELGSLVQESALLIQLGHRHLFLGNATKALELYRQALRLRQQSGSLYGEASAYYQIANALSAQGRTEEAIASYEAASATYLRAEPPDETNATDSLSAAFSLALRQRLWARAAALLAALERLHPPSLDQALRRAQLSGQSGAVDANAAYERLAAQASTQPLDVAASVKRTAQAGLLRSRYRAHWPDCPGMVVTHVVPRSTALLFSLREGDILLRYQGKCLQIPADLHDAANKTGIREQVVLELFREGVLKPLRLRGGPLGADVEPF